MTERAASNRRQGDLFADSVDTSVDREEKTAAVATARIDAPKIAAPELGHLLIRASAGTGKTFRLSNRYIALLRHCPPERILAVTFTRKAAAEIFERVLSRLAAAALDPQELEKLSAFVGPPTLTRGECLRLLQTLTRELHRIRVGTLDSFFARLGTSFALDVGLPPRWRIGDTHEDQQQTLRAVDAVLHDRDAADVRRLVHLLAKGDVPRSVTRLVLDSVTKFHDLSRLTSEAAWRRITPPRPLSSEEIHQLRDDLAAVQLAGKRLPNARNSDLHNIANEDWEGILSAGPGKAIAVGDGTYYSQPLPDELAAIYERLVRHATAILLTIWGNQNAATYDLLAKFHVARKELISESQSVRFDDVTIALAQGLASVRSAALVHRLDASLDHVLLDEFQDTSLAQWRVLDPFVDAVTSRTDSSFFCVGDVKQAIYGWRGGVAALFDQVANTVAGASVEELNLSFRSSPVILRAANRVFQNLDKHSNLGDTRGDVIAWQASFPEHETSLQTLPGYVSLETTALRNGDAEAHRLACFAQAADTAAKIVLDAPDATIGILTRKNSSVARLMYDLGLRGVLASEEGGVPLVNSAAVQLVQSALRFGDHPGHSIARFHLAHSPLGEHYGVQPRMSGPSAQAAALRIRADLLQDGYEACISRWAQLLRPLCNAREWTRLLRLREVAARYAPGLTLRPRDFADIIDRENVEDPSGSRVRVMTIHKSKGLEFDVVILPELDTNLHDTPAYNACGPTAADIPDTVLLHRNELLASLLPPDLQRAFAHQRRVNVHESLCCLYVAMTRARHALHMIVKPQVAEAGKTVKPPASPAGLVRVALANRNDAPTSMRLYEDGDPHWAGETKSAPPAVDEARTASKATSSGIELAPMPQGRRRGREALSPSRAKKFTIDGAHLLSREGARSTQRGTLWHAWCQRVTWLDEAALDDSILRGAALRAGIDASQADLEIPGFLEAIRRPAISKLLSRTFYSEEGRGVPLAVQKRHAGSVFDLRCHNERSFAIIDDGRHLSGSIDRLVLTLADGAPVAADVIDFKTDMAGEKSGGRAGYIEQLRLYARAVSIAYGIEPSAITSRLVWLATGTVETV